MHADRDAYMSSKNLMEVMKIAGITMLECVLILIHLLVSPAGS